MKTDAETGRRGDTGKKIHRVSASLHLRLCFLFVTLILHPSPFIPHPGVDEPNGTVTSSRS